MPFLTSASNFASPKIPVPCANIHGKLAPARLTPTVNYIQILDALREFTSRERINFLPPAPNPTTLSPYPPIAKYVLDLKNGAKPESAASCATAPTPFGAAMPTRKTTLLRSKNTCVTTNI